MSSTIAGSKWSFRQPRPPPTCTEGRDCGSSFVAPRAAWSKCNLDSISGANTAREARRAKPWHNSPMRTIAEFKIQYQQILDPKGELVQELPAFAHDVEEVLRMYRMMTLVRAMDAKAVNLQRTGKLGTYASCLGHEATHIAVGAAMRPEDVLAPVYREYGTLLWRGVTMREIL